MGLHSAAQGTAPPIFLAARLASQAGPAGTIVRILRDHGFSRVLAARSASTGADHESNDADKSIDGESGRRAVSQAETAAEALGPCPAFRLPLPRAESA